MTAPDPLAIRSGLAFTLLAKAAEKARLARSRAKSWEERSCPPSGLTSTLVRVAAIAATEAGIVLFDHLVGECDGRGQQIEAERPRGLQIDHQFEFCSLNDWQVGWLGAL